MPPERRPRIFNLIVRGFPRTRVMPAMGGAGISSEERRRFYLAERGRRWLKSFRPRRPQKPRRGALVTLFEWTIVDASMIIASRPKTQKMNAAADVRISKELVIQKLLLLCRQKDDVLEPGSFTPELFRRRSITIRKRKAGEDWVMAAHIGTEFKSASVATVSRFRTIKTIGIRFAAAARPA